MILQLNNYAFTFSVTTHIQKMTDKKKKRVKIIKELCWQVQKFANSNIFDRNFQSLVYSYIE